MIVLNNRDYVPQPWHTTLFTIAAAAIATIFNSLFARKLPLVETAVLIIHCLGFFAILIPLWVTAPLHSSEQVWTSFTQDSGWPTIGLSSLVGLSSSIYALLGSDAAVHMGKYTVSILHILILTIDPAEETRDASRIIPWAMVGTVALNGITGLVMAVTFAYCLGLVHAARDPKYGFAYIGTFYNATQSKAGATVISCILTVLLFCSDISNVATASRQMFAFARDNGLPLAKVLTYVPSGWDVPVNCIFVSFCITTLLSLINLGSSVAFNAILSTGVVSLLGSYVITIGCIILKRIRGEPLLPRRWSLGKWGFIMNVIGTAYVLLAYVFAFFPLAIPVNLENMNWACVVYGGVGIISVVYYLISARRTYVSPKSRLEKLET